MKPGDMVCLVRIDPGNLWPASVGIRIGSIGTIISGHPMNWNVQFIGASSDAIQPESYLRLIPPNEPCEAGWDWRNIKCPEGEPV